MTPAGAVIMFICFIGPLLPPFIGFVAGSAYDLVKRERETADQRARARLGARAAAPVGLDEPAA